MTTVSGTGEQMRQLCVEAVNTAKHLGFDPSSYRGLSPFNDLRRNEPFLALPGFAAASTALHSIDGFDSRMGATSADNFVLQFLFNFLGRLSRFEFDLAEFEKLWHELATEISDPDWTYFAACNLKNLTSPAESIDFGDGIHIRARNYGEISRLLGWTEAYIDATLGRDWSEGGGGSHIMLVESRLAKAPENLVLVNDSSSIARLWRALLALRLTKPGFVSPGRIFFTRRMKFRFGLGGVTSSGQSRWDPGTNYELANTDVRDLQDIYGALIRLEAMEDKARPLVLALRAFSSIYNRDHFRAEDRLVDSVTALEAALRLETDLSFRSSFQVAGLLASNDDDRVQIFQDMRTFYDTRSKVVHGGELKAKHRDALKDHERLVSFVRQLLAGFVKATANKTVPANFYSEVDVALQHASRRTALRSAFGWS